MKKLILFPIVLLVVLVIIKNYNIYYPIQIVTTNKSTELSVIGEGKVEVIPDTAYVDLGVTVSNVKTVEAAQKTISDANNKLVSSLKELGIPKEDISTSNFSTFPNYSYEGGQDRIVGYNGNVTISVKVKNKDLVSKVISQASAAGVNEIHGTRFAVDDPAKYRVEARSKAIANAKEQAEKLAKELGISLGKVVNIAETSNLGSPVPMYDKAMMSERSVSNPQLEEGTQTITSVVTLYFEKR